MGGAGVLGVQSGAGRADGVRAGVAPPADERVPLRVDARAARVHARRPRAPAIAAPRTRARRAAARHHDAHAALVRPQPPLASLSPHLHLFLRV